MDEDRRLEEVERSASPSKFPQQQHATTTTEKEERELPEPLSRTATGASSSSTTSSIQRAPTGGVSRIPTALDLERNPTALSRIQTAKSQHSLTVGASIRSRSKTLRPLPAFGAGKEYPPLLPDREEYVVEFDGEDDPLHAQNWSLRKKLPVSLIEEFRFWDREELPECEEEGLARSSGVSMH